MSAPNHIEMLEQRIQRLEEREARARDLFAQMLLKADRFPANVVSEIADFAAQLYGVRAENVKTLLRRLQTSNSNAGLDR